MHGPEDCTDETINRVARRLAGGEAIQAPDPFWYFLGVARNVAREHHARRERETRALRQWPAPDLVRSIAEAGDAVESSSVACVSRCLDCLPPDDRDVIVDYYRGDKATKIANRDRLARRLRLTPNALRIRAHRIRARLETCIRSCIDRRGGVK